MTLIEELAKKHKDWINMAKSFKVTKNEANELVQGMYIRMCKYVTDVDRIMYSDNEINTYYVYRCLQNMYYQGYHKNGNSKSYNANQTVFMGDYLEVFVESEEYTYKNDYKVFDEDVEDNALRDEFIYFLSEKIPNIISEWRWYDKKLFEMHYYKGLSMREIARRHNVSAATISTTLKKCRAELESVIGEDYINYLESLNARKV